MSTSGSQARSPSAVDDGGGNPPTTANILAFHGGGFLGYFSALMAERLEEARARLQNQGSLPDSFDLIAGVSAGSIIAAGLAAGVSPAEIVKIMRDNGEAIFPGRRFFKTAPGIFKARFSAGPLKEVLEQTLGDRSLGEVGRPLLIPAFNQTAGKPVIFRTFDPNQAGIRLVDAVLASAAAPTYLPRHKIGDDFYADGGLIANGPALLAARDMARLFKVPIQRQRIVSIGTTISPAGPAGKRASWGALSWTFPKPRLLDILMGGQVDLQNDLLEALDPLERIHLDHTLLSPDADNVHLVLANPLARKILEQAAESCANNISADVRRRLETVLEFTAAKLVYVNVPGGGRLPRLMSS